LPDAMISEGELDRLLEASSPYPRKANDGMSSRAQADLQHLLAGADDGPAPKRVPRIRAWVAASIAVAAVAFVVVGAPFVANLGRSTPPVTAGVPTPEVTPSHSVAPAPADGMDAFGTFLSPDGSTKGRVDVRVSGDSVTVQLVYLTTSHDELTASGSLTSREGSLCLDGGTDVEFGAFRPTGEGYTWLVEGNALAADWTELHEIDLAVTAPAGESAECTTTIAARAVLDWSGDTDRRAIEYESAIASWPEPLPPGYSWPAWSDLPHTEPYGVGDFHEADNAAGVYRCILLDAAWHAYFEDDDAIASRDFATRADTYAIAGNDATPTVTVGGVIVDEELARANGICQGISGDASP
jgi:hypothetical protein